MKKNLVEAVLVIDGSGSMTGIKNQTITSINEFIQEQRKTGKDVRLTIAMFNTGYELYADHQPIDDVAEVTQRTYVTSGLTALYDAIGKTITSIGNRLANTDEANRPEKVVFGIITDGMENASTEYTSDKIQEMIQHQGEKYLWDFAYLGANQDAILAAKTMGIDGSSALNFVASERGISGSLQAVSAYFARSYENTTMRNDGFTSAEASLVADATDSNS